MHLLLNWDPYHCILIKWWPNLSWIGNDYGSTYMAVFVMPASTLTQNSDIRYSCLYNLIYFDCILIMSCTWICRTSRRARVGLLSQTNRAISLLSALVSFSYNIGDIEKEGTLTTPLFTIYRLIDHALQVEVKPVCLGYVFYNFV